MQKFNDQKYRHPHHQKLHLYKRKNSENWWALFYHKGKAYRTSTKTKHQSDAETFAADWWLEKQIAIKAGVVEEIQKNLPTVKNASILVQQEYRKLVAKGKRSQQYLDGVIKVTGKHILPFFEKVPVQDVDAVLWKAFQKNIEDLSRSTKHQIRNALSLCMNAAVDEGWIKTKPTFKIESESNKDKKGRVWFSVDEQPILLQALEDNIEKHKHTPHRNGSIELRDYVLFILYSGLRVGETNNVKFADIEIKQPEDTLIPNILIKNIQGKRGTGMCRADRKLIPVYKSILERVNPKDLQQPIFQYHHDRMFTKVLEGCGLKFDTQGRKRDFISLRHTYISNKILERVPHYDIAANCRTSVDMIQKHYARFLQPELMDSINQKEDKEIKERIEDMVDKQIELDKTKAELIANIKEYAKLANLSPKEVAELIK
ncbi:MAG: phage integrase SAM-like domain-containing protein [Candidatus Thiodiazotropha sp.]